MISLVFWAITIVVTHQVRRAHHARRQRRRGRDHGADRAAASPLGAVRRKACSRWPRWGSSARRCSSATASSPRRSRCSRRSRGSRSSRRRCTSSSCRSRAAILIVLFADPAPGHGRGRPDLRPRDGRVVRHAGRSSGSTRSFEHPGILRALSPTYAVQFFADDGLTAFLSLGGVVLAVTGAEALYADMGHFGRSPIRRAWFFLVFPALTLNYLGQGALLTRRPLRASNPFYLLDPALGAAADGLPRHVGDDHRLAVGHLGRVLGHPPGGAPGLPAAAARSPTLRCARARSTCRSSTGRC